MSTYDVAFIGTGPEPDNPVWGESAAMAYNHGDAYRQLEDCSLVACADIVPENAAAFAEEFAIPDEHIFEDYDAMLREVEPDIVSVCTPPKTHADIVVDCAQSGVLDAIHCEKPMAHDWGASRLMAQECQRRDVQLTFNHQRRFGAPTREAKRLLDEGTIGELERVECSTRNLYDAGTHFIDLCGLFVGERPADWVLGQVNYDTENVRYGVHNENDAVATWQYDNGVYGLAAGGDCADMVDPDVRLLGSEGRIDLNPSGDADILVVRADGSREAIETDGPAHDITAALADVVSAIDGDHDAELRARNALNAMEIIFGAYESVRSRERVEMPLDSSDHPLEALVDAGEITPRADDD
jgi:predicted dehydrogenase